MHFVAKKATNNNTVAHVQVHSWNFKIILNFDFLSFNGTSFVLYTIDVLFENFLL